MLRICLSLENGSSTHSSTPSQKPSSTAPSLHRTVTPPHHHSTALSLHRCHVCLTRRLLCSLYPAIPWMSEKSKELGGRSASVKTSSRFGFGQDFHDGLLEWGLKGKTTRIIVGTPPTKGLQRKTGRASGRPIGARPNKVWKNQNSLEVSKRNSQPSTLGFLLNAG